jgi:hypothetical protein
MSTRRYLEYSALLILGMVTSSAVMGQDAPACKDDETLTACWDRLIAPSTDVASGAVASEAANKDQPGSTSANGQTSSTVTDLIPWLNALGVLSDSDASDGAIAVDLNFLLPGSGERADRNAQLAWAIDVAPKLSDALKAALPEETRDERAQALQKKIGDTADSELQFTWSVVNSRLGRDFRQHRDDMNRMLGPVVRAARGKGATTAAFAEYIRDIEPLIDAIPEPAGITNASGIKFNDKEIPEPVRVALRLRTAAAAVRVGERQRIVLWSLRPQLESYQLDALPKLILQQPQLLFSATRQFRDEFVGPDSWGAKVSYEGSFASFGHFLRTTGATCRELTDDATITSDQTTACYNAYASYLAKHRDTLAREDRWKVTVEYKKTAALQVELPDDGITFRRPKFDRLIASAGFGRTVARRNAKDRVDFEAAYDSNLDDDDRYKDRFWFHSLTHVVSGISTFRLALCMPTKASS